MIVEQIRYHVSDENVEAVLSIRRQVAGLRKSMNLPEGNLLVADPPPEKGPTIVYLCQYEDDVQMGMVESKLIGVPEYEEARKRLGDLVSSVELEIFSTDDEEGHGL